MYSFGRQDTPLSSLVNQITKAYAVDGTRTALIPLGTLRNLRLYCSEEEFTEEHLDEARFVLSLCPSGKGHRRDYCSIDEDAEFPECRYIG